ncbi:MAG: PhoX family protein [Gallionella sp.]|nr:PhoX family protein [Gallionella sp.]
MMKNLFAAAIGAVFSMNALAGTPDMKGAMSFDPIPASAYNEAASDPAILNSEPWVIPQGYRQIIISDESALDIYAGMSDWGDMNTVNETKKHAGRYMYRTHEVRPGADLSAFTGGAVSVIDLNTGTAKIIAQRKDWEALDGIVWTPWHTLLFAEEVVNAALGDPQVPQATSGLLYEMELDKHDLMTASKVSVRPLLGSLSHEGIEIDAEGNVYVIDEEKTGAIYKFVPETYGDLSAGQLYALRVKSSDKTGEAEWVALDMSQAQISARIAAKAVDATQFCRPEDLERIGNTLFVALTCEDVTNPASTGGAGAVLSVRLSDKPKVSYFVAHGVNVVHEDQANRITGFKRPDNLANGPDGKLWIVEDNDYSDIWVAEPDLNGDGYSDGVNLFASLKDVPAEGTGIYFGKDPHTLYVNVQHSGTGNDKTMVITKRAHHHGHE